MKNFKLHHLLSLLFLTITITGSPAFAQNTDTTVGACIDSDGDGWGWDGENSCQAACIDSDGDGWGWDGYASCQVTSASSCLDTDGDGWGWDGNRSCRLECIDTDGDGWGWDGEKSCSVDNLTAERAAFKQQLIGNRVSECISFEPDSYQIVDSYTDHYNIEDFRYFRGNTTCQGIPLSLAFPLQVWSYEILDRITTEGGRTAWQIDWTSVQRGLDDYDILGEDYGSAVGDVFNGIVAIENDLALFGVGDATGSPVARETQLAAESTDTILQPYGDPTLDVATLVASTWVSDCVFRVTGSAGQDTITFTGNSETFERTVYNTEDCSADVDYTYRLTLDMQFQDEVTDTVFGGNILRYREEITDAVIVTGTPPATEVAKIMGFVGRVKYQAFGLIEDTIVSGHCLFSTGCEQSPAAWSDMLDLGFLYRWTRQ